MFSVAGKSFLDNSNHTEKNADVHRPENVLTIWKKLFSPRYYTQY